MNDEAEASEASEAVEPSFLQLPKDLCLKCMLGFDWNSLAMASCVSREMLALVRDLYWSVLLALCTAPGSQEALSRVLACIAGHVHHPPALLGDESGG